MLFSPACRWEAQWDEMQTAACVKAAGMQIGYRGDTAARQDACPRGCPSPQCGQLKHKLGAVRCSWPRTWRCPCFCLWLHLRLPVALSVHGACSGSVSTGSFIFWMCLLLD